MSKTFILHNNIAKKYLRITKKYQNLSFFISNEFIESIFSTVLKKQKSRKNSFKNFPGD